MFFCASTLNIQDYVSGKIAVGAAVPIVCNEISKSRGFVWSRFDTANLLGAQCHHENDAAGKQYGDLPCKPFACSVTGWCWLP